MTKRLFVALTVLVLAAVVVSADNWPQWRGPNRDGAIAGFTAPAAWPAFSWPPPPGPAVAACPAETTACLCLRAHNP